MTGSPRTKEAVATVVAARVYLAVVGLSVVAGLSVLWPTLDVGLVTDDFLFAAMVDGRFAAPRAPWDLFNFGDGSQQEVAALKRLGSVPWWAPDDFRITMLRPLSSLLFYLDRLWFGDDYWAYHAHSLLWWVAFICSVAWLYRRILPLGVASLALVFVALDVSHHGPALWLANRGGLISAAFGLIGLGAYLRFRRTGHGPSAAYAALAYAVALSAGEWALPMFAYPLAYELAWARGPVRTRVLSLLPVGLPALLFLALRALLEYGASGSGVYVDPAAEPGRFVGALSWRLPVLIGDMVLGVSASAWDVGTPWRNRILAWGLFTPEQWASLPDWQFFQVALGLLSMLLLGWLAGFTLRRCTAAERSCLRFLLVGALLSLLPVVASFPSTRLTLAAFIGIAPLFAAFAREALRALYRLRRLSGFLALWICLNGTLYLHVVEGLAVDLRGVVDYLRGVHEWVRQAQIDPTRSASQRVYLVSSYEFGSTYYFAYYWGLDRTMPQSVYPLTIARLPLEITRVGDQSFELEVLGGALLKTDHETMFRPPGDPLQAGERIALPGLQIEVLRTFEGLPQSLRVHIDRSLDDPDRVFLVSTRTGLRRMPFPPVGQAVRLPPPSNPTFRGLSRGSYDRAHGLVPWLFFDDPLPAFLLYDPEA